MTALATGIDRSRWAPHVINLSGPGALVEPLETAGIPTTSLSLRKTRPWSVVPRLAAELRGIRPAIVQSFLFHANLAAKLAAPLAGRPPVVTGIRVAEREKSWHLTLDRMTQGLAAAVVCVSKGVGGFSIKRGGLDPHKIRCISNGVDTKMYDAAEPLPRSELQVAETDHVALFVGRMERQKGIDPLLTAAALVAKDRPSWRLVMVGEGPACAEARARASADPILRGHVRWLGRRSDVPRLLKSADLLVLPSLWEGMPNVVLEAMAAGCGVVATKVEGTEELIRDGETGRLVPPGDAAALAQALAAAADDPETTRRLARSAYSLVETDFRADRMPDEYDRLWSSVLGFAPDPVVPVHLSPPFPPGAGATAGDRG